MTTILFFTIIVISILLTVYFSLKKRIICPNCRNEKVTRTGGKKYKENPPIALWGSPDSYHEFEFKCEICGEVFWAKEKAVIFN